MKRLALSLALLSVALAAYLMFWPVPIEPTRWTAKPSPGYTGVHAANTRLSNLTVVPLGADTAPEHIVLHTDGKLYLAVDNGKVLRMKPDGTDQELFATTGGRVLGFDFDAAGNLIAADAIKGLLAITPAGAVTVLANTVEGDPIRFADAVVVAANGKVYLTDATTRFSPADLGLKQASLHDIVEQSGSGRVIEYDPATKAARIVVHGLNFANGIALTRDQAHLLVVEMARYRVWKIGVDADQLDIRQATPQASVLLDNLPGFPDNLLRGRDGRVWLGLASPRLALLDDMSDAPALRKLLLRLPPVMRPPPPPYGHAIAFTDDGTIVEDLQDPTGAFPEVTGITETDERRYVQSLNPMGLAWLERTEP
ncbi:SMP-30/gluconolactonase/LRE family protein [Tahibacter amnicola]|uniref:SMP-30/gluconolactonase/LRE family protein n=1 Tax=Tahibacter amnicola TaxID=2976241 RepID=A0ABY6BJE9_9GAMM|nr:SMP-30/gluconolactonase/LRE family protein [Tahibacter amnicola]UXI70143.1 SMP-30/gluconolactonase/LRE family protein [Tahibacter amnicola]